MAYGDNNSSGFGSRILLACIIAGVGFFMYMMQTQENPVTGEKQHVTLSPSQEIRLGLESAPEMAAQMGGEVSNSDPRTKVVDKIGRKVINQSKASHTPWKFQFHLLNDPKTINAFALPGGQIFITLGLFNKLKTEAQLAGVLGHEAGHVIERHSAQQMAKGQLGQLLVFATGVGASQQNGGYEATMIANVINQMIQLRYSRHDELEADSWGLMLMSQAGYTPQAMIEVMQILNEAAGRGQSPEFLQTHPYPETRMKEIKAYLQKNPSSANLSNGKQLSELVSEERSW